MIVKDQQASHAQLAIVERYEAVIDYLYPIIQSVSRGVNFLGYRIWPGHKLLRRQSVVRARRKLRLLRAAGDLDALRAFVSAWRATRATPTATISWSH